MARCKVDVTTSPTLAKLLRKLRKKYRHIEQDLMAVVPEIAADYTLACNAARPPKRKLGIEYWKYDFGSTDLQRSPRNSFRVVGIFLGPEEAGKERTMYMSIAYFKGDKSDVTEQEVKGAVDELNVVIIQEDIPEGPAQDSN